MNATEKIKPHKTMKAEKAPARIDIRLLLLILTLAAFGTVMISSASTAYAASRFGDAYYFVKRQAVFLVLGIITMLLTARIAPSHLYRYALPIFLLSLVFLLLVPILGSEAGGAKRWIALGPLTFQPSEFSKSALILLLSKYFPIPQDLP